MTPPPITVAVGRPVSTSAARTPDPAIIGSIKPFAMEIQIVDAGQYIRYIARSYIAICPSEEFVIPPIVPNIPTVLLPNRSDAKLARIIATHHNSPSLFNDMRVYLLIVNFGFAAPHYDLGRAVFVDIDSVKTFFEKNDWDGRSVNLEIEGIIGITILRVDNLELSLIQTIDPECCRSDRQRKTNYAGIELGKAKVGIVIYPDNVAAAQLDLGSPIAPAVKLVAFIEWEVQGRVEPIILRIVRLLVVDLTFDQADASDLNDGIIGQNDGTEGHLDADYYYHRPNTAGALTGGISSKFVKELHSFLRAKSKEHLATYIDWSVTESFYSMPMPFPWQLRSDFYKFCGHGSRALIVSNVTEQKPADGTWEKWRWYV
jgi:hypothetical protein